MNLDRFYNSVTSTEQLWEMLYHRDIEIRLTVLLHPQGLNLLLDRALQLENSLNRFIAGLPSQLSIVQRDKIFYSDNCLDSPTGESRVIRQARSNVYKY
jgi:hypothetical protein